MAYRIRQRGLGIALLTVMSFLVLAEEGDTQKFPRVFGSLLSHSTADTHTLKEMENRDANFDACLLLQAITEHGEGAGSPMKEVVGWAAHTWDKL